MQFTGNTNVFLPQVNQFNFSLTGIRITATGLTNFTFLDTGGNPLTFNFSGGFISTNKIIGTYNTINYNNILGYVSGGNATYSVNGIVNQQTTNFTTLSGLIVNPGNGVIVYGDVQIHSPQIVYNVSFNPTYQYGGVLTGQITSNIAFQISQPSFLFYNSNKNLLANAYTGGMYVNVGTNTFTFNDTDSDFVEYQNNFFTSLPTCFGNIGGNFTSYRNGITNRCVNILSDYPSNLFYQASAFSGEMSGNKFVYLDSPVEYTLNYGFSSYNFLGYEQSGNMSVSFSPIYPANNSGYTGNYITGYTVVSGGLYQQPPTASFSQYFYVTGLQKSMQSFLLSTGCGNSINVTFSGGNPVSGASGQLFLKPVRLSGIYSTGIANFLIASGYSAINDGWGYHTAPQFILGTGGGCYSVPDHSGVQTAQFTFATGYGAIYGQAYGLTGVPLLGTGISGYHVTGLEITNIGVGYNSNFPPIVSFIRTTGDLFGTGSYTGVTADITFQYKNSGLYNFTGVWDISYNVGTGYTPLTAYPGYYSGVFGTFGQGNVSVLIGLSGLDNTSPVSGLLTVTFSGIGSSKTIQDVVLQSRTYNLNTGALAPNSYPTINFFPLPDLLMYLDNDASYQAYLNSLGGSNNIINF